MSYSCPGFVGVSHTQDEENRYSAHSCVLRTCTWNPPDLMSEGVDMDRCTGELFYPEGRCPCNVCSYRPYSWHVAEPSTPAVDTEPPSDPPPSIMNDPYFSPRKCSLGTCCWHLCGNMAQRLPSRYPPPEQVPSHSNVTIKDQFIHHDSIFQNPTSLVTSNYLVHPDWLSEKLNPPNIYPLKRPPWPWEQPRHEANLQIPRTYKMPEVEPTKRHTPLHLPYQPPKCDIQVIKEMWGLHY